jgi:hypothetical protein
MAPTGEQLGWAILHKTGRSASAAQLYDTNGCAGEDGNAQLQEGGETPLLSRKSILRGPEASDMYQKRRRSLIAVADTHTEQLHSAATDSLDDWRKRSEALTGWRRRRPPPPPLAPPATETFGFAAAAGHRLKPTGAHSEPGVPEELLENMDAISERAKTIEDMLNGYVSKVKLAHKQHHPLPLPGSLQKKLAPSGASASQLLPPLRMCNATGARRSTRVAMAIAMAS